MIKRMIIMLVLVGVIFAGLDWFVNFRAGMIKTVLSSLANQPQTVSTTAAKTSEWQPKLTAIGTFRAVNGADLAIEVAGIVQKIQFQSGDKVVEGQVLLELNKDDDIGKLQALEATAELSNVTLKRDEEQLKQKAVSQATVDTDSANQKNALGLVNQQKALVEKKTLRAPFSGLLGIRQVDLGQYLGAGTTIVTLQSFDQIFFDFTLPQQAIDQIRVDQPVEVAVDAYPDKRFGGKITAINPKIDAASRNIQVRATLDNASHALLPGMYASVDVSSGKAETQVTLPQTAIVYNPYGNSVYLIDKSDKSSTGLIARQSFVKTGAIQGDLVAVSDGVKDGEQVVTAGQIKLRNGSAVKIDNSVQQTTEREPKPADQ